MKRQEWTWWKEFRGRFPRWVRIIVNLFLIAVLLVLFYVLNGSPDANLIQAFRREEERNLIGPGNILGSVAMENPSLGYDSLLLAETDEGVILYTYNENGFSIFSDKQYSSNEGRLIYREKGEHVTVMAPPGHLLLEYKKGFSHPVILFNDCPRAVRAELDLHLNTKGYGDAEVTWNLSAQRENMGFFLFDLVANAESTEELENQVRSIFCLYRMFDSGIGDGFPAAVRLYDRNDELILEETFVVHSQRSAAHAKEP